MTQNDLINSCDPRSRLWIAAVLLAVLFSAPVIAGGGGEQRRFATGISNSR